MPVRVLPLVATLLCAGLAPIHPAGAQQQVRPLESALGARIDASLHHLDGQPLARSSESRRAAPPQVSPGDRVVICVRAAEAGFVSVWSRRADAFSATAIYPNGISHPGAARPRAAAIAPGAPVCIGGPDAPFRITVAPVAGASEVYVMWTARMADQLDPGEAIIPTARAPFVTRTAPFAATTLPYIVEASP